MFKKLLNLRNYISSRNIVKRIRYQNTNTIQNEDLNLPIAVDYNQIMIRIQKAKQYEDKYNLQKMQNTSQIFDLVYKPKLLLTLNDYIKILEKLTTLCQGQTYQQIYGIEKILTKIEEKLKISNNYNNDEILDDEFTPYIGSLMKSLNIIEYYKNMELWMKICDQICQERMDFTSNEIKESLLGLFIIKKLSNKEWQQKIVQNSIRLLLNYFEVHLSKNQFNLQDIITLGQALHHHYGTDYLKNKTYILQTIEINASTQIKTLQDELHYSQTSSQNDNPTSNQQFEDQQDDNNQYSENSTNQDFQEKENINKSKQNNEQNDSSKKHMIENNIKRQLIQIGFLFSLCNYKSSFLFNQIAFYFQPSYSNQQEIIHFFQQNKSLLSKFYFYLVENYKKKNIPNIQVFIQIIENIILSNNKDLNQISLKELNNNNENQQSEQNDFDNSLVQNKMNSEYKIVMKRDLHYDDIKLEQLINQQKNKSSQFSLEDLCILLECSSQIEIENIQNWIEQIDISFSHLDSQSLELMDIIRFWRARLVIEQLEFSETPSYLIEIIKLMSVRCQFSQIDVIDFIQFCDDEKLTHIFVDLYNYLPYYVANNIYFYNWEEMCLLYYHFIKDKILFKESSVQEINGRLNVLKQYIKLEYFSYNNRKNQKMSSESHFYKVLSVVDINDFYAQDSSY